MNQRRPPAPPPRIPGFQCIELLGSGGFADVYRYEQELPRRQVAIKVLLPDRMGATAGQFTAEANTMAMLSSHPAIVTILQAGVSDDGRPYLVMEYCPGANLQVRYRREPFSVAEALRVGIPIAAAVETAHRAGVLHRDIKPANILVTEYGRPALTDFGIAATAHGPTETTGMSIPWSPPESFGDVARSGPRSDVYQLGATVYTLLAGRSPFEVAGQSNASADLIDRIERMPLPPLDRPDVPEALQSVLERAMAKDPADRHTSALAFARALQKVQIELAHAVTPIDIIDEGARGDRDEDEDGGLTRVRAVMSIAPDAADVATSPRPASAETIRRGAQDEATVVRGARNIHPDDATVIRPPVPASAPESTIPRREIAAEAPRRGRWGWWVSVGVIALAAVAVIGFGLPALLAEPEPEDTPAQTVAPQDPIVAVPSVADLQGAVRGDEVVFTWTNPEPEEGDSYLWTIASVAGEPDYERTVEPTVTVPAAEGETCVEVVLRRASGTSSEPAVACVGG
ncbi:serine/threonine protein kinase [Microbacterium barkeri]|uniref:non-specific serine/threonine protein kinase n=1 Tax=Microbacterium barkeri TaxID=33917 RepID=A0A9W6H5P8_9MICO|nr:serine/threonine-protein kinase [Microbacterium barkeri]MDR6878003.1 hypothetical protein [Microbacterium barkeri]GLJ63045.1 serine/threonine protein kinase [Microbacterium barkeri]